MKIQFTKTFWAVFSIFVWLHILPGAIEPQWNDLNSYHSESVFSFSPNIYSDREFSKDLTVIEFEENYISQATFLWLWSGVLVILGLYSAWLIYQNSKYWPILVLIITGTTCLKVIPDTIELIEQSPSLLDHFSSAGRIFVKSVVEKRDLAFFMKLSLAFAWPFYCLTLFGYASFVIISRFIKHENIV